MPLDPGTRLGPYEIVSQLGQGGMGEVYRARDTRLGRDVAIKVLPAAVAQDADRLARFEREARAVAALNHPNLVTLHSIEEADGIRFLTMELVEGRTLDQVVTAGGLPTARVLELTIPIADALAAAHQKGVVHRDLKPANVMVSREGRVKVLDFGLAKLAGEAAGAGAAAGGGAGGEGGLPPGATQAPTMDSPISAVGLVVGTAPYMAPEQLRGEPVDARTDLFALGIVIYELATGRRPFAGASAVEITSAILRDAPPPLSSVRADAPKDLERILARCLEKDPERRVQTAKDVRNELELLRAAAGPAGAAQVAAPITPPPPVRTATAAAAAPASAPVPPSDTPSIAVLPFVNRSADPSDEYFSEGLADELLSTLVKIRGLRVAARTSAGAFKGKDASIADIGRALRVASVLEGSVRKAGNRVRISVQLVRVADETPLWSETYDRTLDDIFAVQDDIAQSVVKELRTTLLGQAPDSNASDAAHVEVAAAAAGRGDNPEAHRLYLQGVYFLDRVSIEDTHKALAYLEQAVALDAANAQAWAALGRAHNFLAGFGGVDVRAAHALARAATERALALAPDLAEAHYMLAHLQAYQDRNWRAAEASCRRVLELAPGDARFLPGIAQLAQYRGRFEEAEQLLAKSLAVDPLSSRAYSSHGYLLFCMDRLPEAEAAYRKALELSPQRIVCRNMIGVMLELQGQYAAAVAEAQREPAVWARLTSLSFIHWHAGHRAESDAALHELETNFADSCGLQLAALYAARGDADAAFHWLDVADETRDIGAYLAACEPFCRGLHGDPRWLPYLRKLGLLD